MSPMVLLVLFLNVLTDTVGHMSYKFAAKGSEGMTTVQYWKHVLLHPWMWIGIAFHTAEFFLWIAFLSMVPLAVGVMLGSVNVVVLMILGRIMYGERINIWRFWGMTLVCLGIIAVGLGE